MEETRRVSLVGKCWFVTNAYIHWASRFSDMYQACLFYRFRDPQPDYSAFREASYGHSTLEIKNKTHAFYHWNRNDDGKRVPTDSFVLHNQYWWVQYKALLLYCTLLLAASFSPSCNPSKTRFSIWSTRGNNHRRRKLKKSHLHSTINLQGNQIWNDEVLRRQNSL